LNRVQQSPIGKRIVSGTFWSVIGNGFSKMFTFIAMVLVARILGKEAFGEFGLVRSTAMTFVTFSSFGMGLTATKYIAELLHSDKECVGRIIGLTYVFTFFSSLIVAVVFYFISPWICETQLNKPELTNILRLGSVLLFLMTFMGTQVAVMTGFQDFRSLAFATFIAGAVTLPIYIVGSYCWGLWGAIIGAVAATGINVLINSGFIYRNTKKHAIKYLFGKLDKEWSVLWHFNLPIVLSTSMYGLAVWGGQLLLAAQQNGTVELGIYYVAINLYAVIAFLPQQLPPVLFPILSEIDKKENSKQFWKVAGKSGILVFSLSSLVIIPFLIFPKTFMGIFGNSFVDDWKVLISVCICVLASSFNVIVNQIHICCNRSWLLFIWSLIWIIVYYSTLIIMLQENFGAAGLFWAVVIANIIYSFSPIIYVWLPRSRTPTLVNKH
jgi:O-antigen/teichoic acid export membrane protein